MPGAGRGGSRTSLWLEIHSFQQRRVSWIGPERDELCGLRNGRPLVAVDGLREILERPVPVANAHVRIRELQGREALGSNACFSCANNAVRLRALSDESVEPGELESVCILDNGVALPELRFRVCILL